METIKITTRELKRVEVSEKTISVKKWLGLGAKYFYPIIEVESVGIKSSVYDMPLTERTLAIRMKSGATVKIKKLPTKTALLMANLIGKTAGIGSYENADI